VAGNTYQEFIQYLQVARRPHSKVELAERIGLSVKTIQRYLDRLMSEGANVEVSKLARQKRYRLLTFALPGNWFDTQNVRALSLMLELQEELGVCGEVRAFAGLRERLRKLTRQVVSSQTHKPILIKRSAHRAVKAETIHTLLQAIQLQTRARFHYRARTTADAQSEIREVSPHQLELYRGNWYLLAWCHRRLAWRYFALERLENPEQTDTQSAPKTDPPKQRGYGIFDLEANKTAVLRFSPFRSQWIKDESWHPNQIDEVDCQTGALTRQFPYGDDTELLRDLMREGADVEVLAPEQLKARLRERYDACLKLSNRAVMRQSHKLDQRNRKSMVAK
jgi:proteasome accessory factor C